VRFSSSTLNDTPSEHAFVLVGERDIIKRDLANRINWRVAVGVQYLHLTQFVYPRLHADKVWQLSVQLIRHRVYLVHDRRQPKDGEQEDAEFT